MAVEKRFKVLVVTDDDQVKRSISSTLGKDGHEVIAVDNANVGLGLVKRGKADMVVVDSSLPNEEMAQFSPQKGHNDRPIFVLALMQNGSVNVDADDFLEKPIDGDKLREIVEKTISRKRFLDECPILGKSERISEIIETIVQIAPTNVNVLISGESGTGKDLAAISIHHYSGRKGRFLHVNCGAIPENLLESELFGHEKGAFTGALSQRKGYFEAADQGTIFLDEIGEMSLMMQVKLLHVLDEKEFIKVGGDLPIRVDARTITATNKNLRERVAQGEFRRDLFYRLRVVEIRMPPLRERVEDIPLLAHYFIKNYAEENKIDFKGISDEAVDVLTNYSWPGNIRELKHTIESMMVLSQNLYITADDVYGHLNRDIASDRNLPIPLNKTPEQSERELIYRAIVGLKSDIDELKRYVTSDKRRSLEDSAIYTPQDTYFREDSTVERAEEIAEEENVKSLGEVEKDHIVRALRSVGGNRRKAAQILGIGERTLYRKIKSFGIL